MPSGVAVSRGSLTKAGMPSAWMNRMVSFSGRSMRMPSPAERMHGTGDRFRAEPMDEVVRSRVIAIADHQLEQPPDRRRHRFAVGGVSLSSILDKNAMCGDIICSMKRLAFALLFTTLTARAGTLLVLNKADATLSFVDLATLKTLATIPTGLAPHEVAASDDGRIAVVANYGTGPSPGTSLSVIDVAAHKELRRFELPGLLRPHGIVAAGLRFWFTAEGSRVIARYDAATDRIDFISGSGADTTHMIIVLPGEKTIYTANISSNSVTVFDLSGAPRTIGLKQIPVVKGPEGIDLAPDGSELWVASRAANGGIAIINPATNTVTQTLPTTTKVANRVKFTRDGKFVLVSDPEANLLLVYDAATKEVIKTVEMAAGPSGILMTPDGKRAFVACAGAKRVQVVDLSTFSITNDVETGNTPDGLAYAP